MEDKNMKKIIIPVLIASLAVVSCTQDYLIRNTNQEQATDAMMDYDGLRTSAPLSQMMANVVPTYQPGENAYLSSSVQVAYELNGNIFIGYEGATKPDFDENNLYNLNPSGWSKAMFNDAFTRAIAPWLQLNEIREDHPEMAALADILKVAVLSRVTDAYGPIPYSQLTSGSLTVAYDSQEEVYGHMFDELGAAIDLLSEAPSSVFATLAASDRVFYGNLAKWIQFANTLRLRLALRVAYVDETLYETQAQAALANSFGLLTENASIHKGAGAWENPFYVIEYTFNDGDAKIGATITTYMNGYQDPRRSAYFTAGSDGNYHGVRMGAVVNEDYPKSTLWSLMKVTNDDPVLWMSGAESFFLLAEHALRQNDAVEAKAQYEAGIAKSFNLWGVSGADAYISAADRTVGSYTDPVAPGNSYGANLTNVSIAWDSQNSFEGHLEQIITQKYLAIFPEGQEAWSEFRRTGYPKVIPTKTNNSAGHIDTQLQVRRLPYPTDEYQANNANVQAAVSILNNESTNKGGDYGGTRLWWDKNTRF